MNALPIEKIHRATEAASLTPPNPTNADGGIHRISTVALLPTLIADRGITKRWMWTGTKWIVGVGNVKS